MSESLALASGWTLAGIFLLAALHKLRNHFAFRGILSQYRLLPDAFVPAVVPLVIAGEVAAALSLLKPASLLPGLPASLVAAVLLSTYTVAIAINLIRGRTAMDCGCGGAATPLSGWLLFRNGLLLGLAWVAGTAATLEWNPGVLLLAAATTAFLWCAYAIGNQLLANRPGAWSDPGSGEAVVHQAGSANG